jgi:hypothetical protein
MNQNDVRLRQLEIGVDRGNSWIGPLSGRGSKVVELLGATATLLADK